VPAAVGIPLIVMVLAAQAAVTPAGRPVAVPIPVAPVVVCVIAVRAVLVQMVGMEEAAPAVLSGVTIIVPVAFTLSHPPVSGMV
jgi:L-lactate permease